MRCPFSTSQASRSREAFQHACLKSDLLETQTDLLLSRTGRRVMENAQGLRDATAVRLRLGRFPEQRAADTRLVKNLDAGLRDPRIARAWLAQHGRAFRRLIRFGAAPTPRQLAAARQERA